MNHLHPDGTKNVFKKKSKKSLTFSYINYYVGGKEKRWVKDKVLWPNIYYSWSILEKTLVLSKPKQT